ncbi:PP2C family serine/threonine-protein phosphatase [Legionella sp. 16cNR16C]|uniref:PP2C family serine/threonine-protein phosphatase n=1 Tax=Legionella sp. 16cNR16C TaxID=2905656 RepID=UPI001E313A2B|nr:PP2C family serine/threonine-protein phosphatase [Legionella sp. 16cNR16C]MCE3043776.1 hypothetical protein [Legionella sp. 16cNR16C]
MPNNSTETMPVPGDNPNDNISKHRYAGSQLQGGRAYQEDTAAWFKSDSASLDLTPLQIGQRLWTAYRQIDAEILRDKTLEQVGSTAVTTVIKNNFLITALLADAAAFAAVYNESGEVIDVYRLNAREHKPELERARIMEFEDYYVLNGRVWGRLAVSRAIGDAFFLPVIADSDISIVDLSNIPAGYSVKLISCSDGFTDGARKQVKTLGDVKKAQENYLKEAIAAAGKSETISEGQLSDHLAYWAITNGSSDNVTVAVQTVKRPNEVPGFMGMSGVYDGHGGQQVSAYIAARIQDKLETLFAMSEEDYQKLEDSAFSQEKAFLRDNTDLKVFDLNTRLKKPEPVSETSAASDAEKLSAPGSSGFFESNSSPKKGLKRTVSILDLKTVITDTGNTRDTEDEQRNKKARRDDSSSSSFVP